VGQRRHGAQENRDSRSARDRRYGHQKFAFAIAGAEIVSLGTNHFRPSWTINGSAGNSAQCFLERQSDQRHERRRLDLSWVRDQRDGLHRRRVRGRVLWQPAARKPTALNSVQNLHADLHGDAAVHGGHDTARAGVGDGFRRPAAAPRAGQRVGLDAVNAPVAFEPLVAKEPVTAPDAGAGRRVGRGPASKVEPPRS